MESQNFELFEYVHVYWNDRDICHYRSASVNGSEYQAALAVVVVVLLVV